MKITLHQLKKLIREYSEFFGNEFMRFKNAHAEGQHPLTAAYENLIELGSGSTRVVFEFTDNKSQVLKVINSPENSYIDAGGEDERTGFSRKNMIDSNIWESDLKMQMLYPDIFPRTFEVSPDRSWILAERVDPINRDTFIKMIGLEGEGIKPGYLGNIKMQALIALATMYFKERGNPSTKSVVDAVGVIKENETLTHIMTNNRPGRESTPKAKGSILTKTVIRRLRKMLADPHMRKIYSAMAELGIPPREFSPKNLGISRISRKLMILDASLWEEHREVR
tara:strand:+ start:6647 stop:7489 length:843 start_codon:yes stop_codon:yes gene_type:complete